ncbi:FabD/lysophospholipase-like protein [Trichodelitschia bisporula]|uniref:FabD/lysophospholipase-like protein n=1 Tax=Trichodelitschia bisporula TaxID=703511 RepID=A0A6G1IAB2_9PEZI|nr:FabD/lysophospholipase-like protein [Trichodelitschia bisporula]
MESLSPQPSSPSRLSPPTTANGSPAPPQRPRRPLSVTSSQDDVRWAETVDDPWLPAILTLDGGGIRGYSSLLILKRLMTEIAALENKFEERHVKHPSERRNFDENTLLPCHYFDVMYGTSTGGLIATMLGRLRMNITACLEAYRAVGNDLFGKRRSNLPLRTKYHHQPLQEAVKRLVRENCPLHEDGECDGSDWHPWHLHPDGTEPLDLEPYYEDTAERICQTVCLTATHNKRSEAYLLRSYNHRYFSDVPVWVTRYNEGADALRIWEVTRATSAAPFFFKALEADIQSERKVFKDGGIRANNPSVAAWTEFVSLYGERAHPALLLSIGTGRHNMDQDGFASAWPGPFGRLGLVKRIAENFAVFRNMLVKYTQSEEHHQAMLNTARGQHTWYKRLNVSSGMETMRLDNWEPEVVVQDGKKVVFPGNLTLKRMEVATTAYLSRDADPELKEYASPHTMLEQVAEKLVRQRRAREATADRFPERWANYMGLRLRQRATPALTPAPAPAPASVEEEASAAAEAS